MPTGQNPKLGILLMLAAMVFIPVLDICAKYLSQDYGVLQITWSRFAFNVLWLIPLLIWLRERWWRLPERPWVQLIRGLSLVSTTMLFFLSIRDNPIPIALAILFISPLVVSLLSPLVLGEPFGLKRFIATLAGFAGVLIVLQPNSPDFNPSLLYALLAGISYGAYMLITRKLSGSGSSYMTAFYSAAVATLFVTPLVMGEWVTPNINAWMLMALMGFMGALAHLLITLACRYASASLVSPFTYAEIIAAVVLNYLFFNFFPDLRVWIGILVVVGSGIYLWRLETAAKPELQG